MEIIKYPTAEAVDAALREKEPLLMLCSFDGAEMLVSQIDEAVEHHILLEKAFRAGLIQHDSRNIDKYFRAVADEEGADWTFVCPPDYRGISDKVHRISAFYRDGIEILSEALKQLGLPAEIEIPKRYRRHLDVLGDNLII